MKPRTWGARCRILLGAVFAASCLVGCGGKTPVGSVSGKVTLHGAPLTTGTVLFSNRKTGVGASAALDASGTYKVPSIRTGEYQVAIQPPPAPAPHEMEKAAAVPRVNLPAKYQDPTASGLKATVKEGSNTSDFAL